MSAAINSGDVLARVHELPKLPQAVHEIFLAMNDENLGLEDFSRKIAIDPSMVAKILRAANSPFYGMSGQIASIPDAIRLIGLRSVGTLLTTAAVMRSIAPPNCLEFNFRAFWEHSLATAVCSQELARACGSSQTIAFAAGLLHDIGRLVLATHYPEELGSAIRRARDLDCPLYEAEISALGVGHAEVGAWLAEHWHFADPVSDAIRYHHEPASASFPPTASLPEIVHAADGIVHALDLVQMQDDFVPRLQVAAWEHLNLAQQYYERVFERTEEGFTALREALT